MLDTSNSKKPYLFGFAGAVLTILLSIFFSDLFRDWDRKTLDMRFQLRGPITTDPNIVMIDADDPSAEVYGRWPWPRSVHAEMIDFLRQENSGVTVFDILFAQPVDDGGDSRLVEATKNNAKVIYPVAVDFLEQNDPATSKENPALPSISRLPAARENSKEFKSVKSVTAPLPQLLAAADGIGHIATNRDKDGMVRRVPLLVRYNGKLLPSLSLQVVLNYLGVPLSDIKISKFAIHLKGAATSKNNLAKDISIPVDSNGQMLINYAGRWEETFKHASFASVLSNDSKISKNGEDLTGKLVLVSNTMTGADIKSIPIEESYPGSGIHANIINTILTGSFLRETGEIFNVSLIFLMGIATSTILFSRNYLVQSVLVILLAVGYAVANFFVFQSGLVMELFHPLCSIILTALLVSVYHAGAEKERSDSLLKEKSRVESHLSSIVRDLTGKEEELQKIQSKLNTLQEGVDRGRDLGDAQAQEIDVLKMKLQSLIEDKDRLLEQRKDLESKVLDLRVHISIEKPSGQEDQYLKQECEQYGIRTQNPKTLETYRILKKAAAAPSSVLILGETGTGKELFANALHKQSDRKDQPFIAVNCGAIPHDLLESELFGYEKGAFTGALQMRKGRLEQANKGTIFLDEIGDMPQALQVKLLRVIAERKIDRLGGTGPINIDVRFITATHRNLKDAINEGKFREDLYYRINTIPIELPPLRERKEDIEMLASYFCEKYSKEYEKDVQGISEKAITKIKKHRWPGNIRELENVIQRGITMATGSLIQENDLGLDNGRTSNEDPDELLLSKLQENGFEINQTASDLEIHRNTVTARFKGICFDLLVKHQVDLERVAGEISGGASNLSTVSQMIREYHENLANTVRNCQTLDEAIETARKINKNVPAHFHSAIEELVRIYRNDNDYGG